MLNGHGYLHIAKNIPNNWFTRKMVNWMNRYLTNIHSMLRLKRRYRKPKVGKYSPWGDVKRDNAKTFSLYVILTKRARSKYPGGYRIS